MKITFYGAARTVTGSMFVIEAGGRQLLLDCGLYQGKRKEAYEINKNFPFDPASIDAVILSHAHIDHSGNLPNLVKNGFRGRIHATHVTTHLVSVMLADSGHIQEQDAEYLNRKNKERGGELIEPLYTVADAAQVNKHLQRQAYDRDFTPIPGVTACLVEAGHILGSASISLTLQENGRTARLWFSGDVGRWGQPLVRDPILPKSVDYLLMECTYGDKPHQDPEKAYEDLRKVITAVIARKGKVIIPAFAVGRTQDLVYDLHRMIEARDIPKVPIFVDSPLAVSITDIFQNHIEYFDEETHDFMKAAAVDSPLDFGLVTYTRSVEESKAINRMDGPLIIISASGMAETGRILHHLANNIGDPRNLILLVSYQAPHTLGRRLQEGEKQVKIFGDLYNRKADVVALDGFSAHAGQDFLVEYALATRDSLKSLFLVHGEEQAAGNLRRLLEENGIDKIVYPYPKQSIELD